MRDQLDPAQYRLYDLIWRRFVASQMAAARFLNTRASLAAGDYLFRASGSVLQFDGFQKVWKREEEKDKERDEHVCRRSRAASSFPASSSVASSTSPSHRRATPRRR